MKDHFTQYIRGDSESETMDIYTRVDREDARDAYLNCIKPLDLWWTEVMRIGKHEVREWKDRDGQVLGASVFLCPKEVEELRNKGKIEIEMNR